jgi:meiotically up-regulated gene 157 (Mug157) protein
MVKGLTGTSDEEVLACLDMLKKTTAGSGFMHESFWKDDPSIFTRSWFAWANTLFGELMLAVAKQRPHLIFGQK